jgi:outer membrane protein OmpA-like peptidoglycan-associated protein
MLRVCLLASALLTACATAPKPRDVSSLVELEGDSIIVREAIQFESGKAEIAPRSTDLLDAVAKILNSNTSITTLTIEGHTDTTGEPSANPPLSEARANAVKKYLESKGVNPNRLQAKGYGSDRPLDTNDTEEGRARNRRVEFKVTK